MFCSFYLILYIIWFQFSLSLSPFYYFDYYEHQYFTSVLFHMFSFIKNALFGSYSWMSHRTFIESSAVTTAFWLDQYGGRFASIFRRCPPSMFWGQWDSQTDKKMRHNLLHNTSINYKILHDWPFISYFNSNRNKRCRDYYLLQRSKFVAIFFCSSSCTTRTLYTDIGVVF